MVTSELVGKLIYFSIIFQLIFNLFVGMYLARQAENVAALEDIVFVHGIYKEIGHAP